MPQDPSKSLTRGPKSPQEPNFGRILEDFCFNFVRCLIDFGAQPQARWRRWRAAQLDIYALIYMYIKHCNLIILLIHIMIPVTIIIILPHLHSHLYPDSHLIASTDSVIFKLMHKRSTATRLCTSVIPEAARRSREAAHRGRVTQ